MNPRVWLLNLLLAALLTGCAAPRFDKAAPADQDKELARLSQLARAAYDKGSLAQAETLYRQAHRRARELDSANEISDSAYNLAAVLITRDRRAEAAPLLAEAEAELQRAGQSPADVQLLKARLAVMDKQPAGALPELEAVAASRTARPTQRAHAALLRGEIACDASDAALARRQLEAAKKWAPHPNPFLAAQIEKLTGRVALLEQHPAEAAAAFQREADLYQRARQPLGMAQALTRAGEAFAQAGNASSSAHCFYRAARSLLAQGQAPAAQPLIERGLKLATQSGDASLQAQLRHLATEAAVAPR